MSTQTFYATGLTCGHCAAAVTEELSALAGVEGADVTPVRDGVSSIVVTADREVSDGEVAHALDEAGGYVLVDGNG
ncbi:MAG: heavy-metal-associated domain-containing protein [Actinomycetales bacterium]|nr:heavy-metal-associated domain-containing protein [Actinomycetales bacterium]